MPRVGKLSVKERVEQYAGKRAGSPLELRSLPRHHSEIDRPAAKPKCKGGAEHRFQEEANGVQCQVCGGWRDA